MKYNVCSLDNVKRYIQNIVYSVSVLDDASGLLQESRNWYNNAKALCMDIAGSTGLDTHIVAGVVAVLSPNQNWEVQEKMTEDFIKKVQKGTPYKAVGYGYYANRSKAAEMILNKKVYPYLSGIKVEAFYHNILGNSNIPTIDLWAVRVALKKYNLPKNECAPYMRAGAKRDEIARAYILAAKYMNMAVSETQAVSWVAVREILSKQDL